MAVGRGWVIEEWLTLANQTGFDALKVEDISEAIMPNLLRFQYLARGYFKYPALSRLLRHVLPDQLVVNSIAGLLMPFTIQANVQGYYLVDLARR